QVLACARNKLRLKKATTIFSSNGALLETDNSLRTLANDDVVLVSSGEQFVGSESHPKLLNTDQRVFLLAHKAEVHEDALKQLHFTASLQGVSLAVGYSDLCPGNRFPVGASFLVHNRVYPELIGGDIGCGMTLFLLPTLDASTRAEKLASKLSQLDTPWTGDTAEWLSRSGVEPAPGHDATLGTIGGGNHFAEFQVVESVLNEAAFASLGLTRESMVLLIHSGSRSLGKAVLDGVLAEAGPRVQDGLFFLSGTPEFEEYMKNHDRACAWAKRNRELIAHRILAMLFDTVVTDSFDETMGGAVPFDATYSGKAVKILDIYHNSIERILGDDGKAIYLHRKGAAPSNQGIVPIPGSRGAFTYLVQPEGPQHENAYSLPHGAGRRWTRSKALAVMNARHEDGRIARALAKTDLGSVVVCEDKKLLAEEAPEAYKNIGDVVEDVKGYASAVAVMRPVVTFKFK
ncbi:tRNA-splicing ligase, partial [Chytriomyces sp. MP71]